MKAKKPTTPSQRSIVKNDYKEVTKGVKPLKSLTRIKKKRSGRDNKGHISVRHRGGGYRKRYRIINFNQDLPNGQGTVEAIEYDPNRSAHIARLSCKDGNKCYVLAIEGMKKGQVVRTGDKVPLKVGNRTQLKNIPVGTYVCNVELNPRQGSRLARSAGSGIQLTALDEGMAQLTLNSGEVRMVKDVCMATVGTVSNKDHHNIKIGKAGVKRHMGWRPTVRGAAMNPNDHPHGGGEGKASVGNRRGPRTKWGKSAYGVRTRKKKKYSSKYIIKRRKTKRN